MDMRRSSRVSPSYSPLLICIKSGQHNMLPLITDLDMEGKFPLATIQLDIEAFKAFKVGVCS